jgi:hypothetical protein
LGADWGKLGGRVGRSAGVTGCRLGTLVD